MRGRNTDQPPESPASVTEALAHELFQDSFIADWALIPRHDDVVLYVVPQSAAVVDQARVRLHAALGQDSGRVVLVPVNHIPLTESGEADGDALRALPVIERDVARQWEARLTGSPGVHRAAVEIESNAVSLERVPVRALIASRRDQREPGAGARAAVRIPPAAAAQRNAPALSHGGELLGTPGEPATLATVLEHAALAIPQAECIHILADGSERRRTYADLLAAAQRILGGLRAQGITPGGRLILQIERGDHYLAALWACALGGIVAVPMGALSVADPASKELVKLRAIWAMLEHPSILAEGWRGDAIRELEGIEGERVWSVESIAATGAESPALDHHLARPEDIAFIMLTSGSSGLPKAVPLSNRNLLGMCRGTRQMNGFTRADVTLNWMPLDHVGALVFLGVMAVDLACTQVHVAKEYVLRDPIRWLALIERYRASISWAPNFAFGLIAERSAEIADSPHDLSSMRFLVNAGEANVARTMATFQRQLASCGLADGALRPAFGMSETCSGITWSAGFSLADAGATLVELGRPIPGASLRIVGDRGELLQEGQIGRLQVRGFSVFAGYLGRPDDNASAFQDGWFTTGDLGYLDDGRLIITGRQKDDIIIRGTNYYPHEIESLVEELEGVATACTAACAVQVAGAEREDLALFFHPEVSEPERVAALARRIRGVIAHNLGITPGYVIALAYDEIPRTAVGKIQRSILRQRFAAGDFDDAVLHADASDFIPAWFYRRVWKARVSPGRPRAARPLVRLVYEDALGLMDAVCAELDGEHTVRVIAGDGFLRLGPRRFRIAADQPDDHRAVIDAMAAEVGSPEEILHAWSYAHPVPAFASAGALEGAMEQVISSVLCLARAWRDAAPGARADLRVITSHAYRVTAQEPCSLERSLLPGLLATLAQETPGLKCELIDLESCDVAARAQEIAGELAGPVREPAVCYRGGRRLVTRFEKVAFEQPVSPPWREGGRYLVTGGLGGVGRLVCGHLVARHGATLLVVGRSAPAGQSAGPEPWPEGVPGGGRYESIDICDESAVRDAIERAEVAWGARLDGIVHLAGEVEERALADQTAARLIAAQRAKLVGAWVLHRIAAERQGCSLVQVSSVLGFFGGAGFGAYAAAASFQDAIAGHARDTFALDSVCLSFSQWEQVGISKGHSSVAAHARGFLSLSEEQGISSLDAALGAGGTSLIVGMDGTSPAVRAVVDGPISALTRLCAYVEAESDEVLLAAGSVVDRFGAAVPCAIERLPSLPLTTSGAIDRSRLRNACARTDADWPERVAPRTALEAQLVTVWTNVLREPDLGVYDSFFELGGSSLLAASLVARIRDVLGVELSMSQVFASPTIAGMAAEIEATHGVDAAVPPLQKAPSSGPRPLSFAQERLWMLQRIEGEGATYNESTAMILDGPIDVRTLHDSLSHVVQCHEILRTRFVLGTSGAAQEILPRIEVPIHLEDLQGIPEAQQAKILDRKLEELAGRPFDLAEPPLFRVALFQLAPSRRVLQYVIHHIITDGWSHGIFMRHWSASYAALARGQDPAVPAMSLQYSDFAQWQRSWLGDEVLESQLTYWRAALKGAPPFLELPTDRPRPAVPSPRGAHVPIELDPRLTRALRQVSDDSGATLFMTLMAAFMTVLGRYSGQRDVVVGLPVANRRLSEMEGIMGCFVNTLAMRADLSGEPTFREVVSRVRRAALDAYAHQDLPFERLVEEIAPARTLGHNPIVQVNFDFQDQPLATLRLPGVEVAPLRHAHPPVRVDLELHLYTEDGAVRGYALYARDLFDERTVLRFISAFEQLVREVASSPDLPLSRLSAMPASDREHLDAWNNARLSCEAPACIHDLFSEAASRAPGAPAIIQAGEALSYAEVERRANQLAHYLRALGVGPEVPVAQFLDRSIDMIVGLLGILKAGGVYMPLDPAYPLERLQALLDSGQPPVILTCEALEGELPAHWGQVVCLDAEHGQISGHADTPPQPWARPDSAAYLIHTSGSTGEPKGAVLTHSGFVTMIREQIRGFAIESGDRVAQFASCAFDASLSEIFMALGAGACLVPVPGDVQRDPSALRGFLASQEITVITLPPSYLRLMERAPLPPLRVMISAGEAADVADLCFYAHAIRCFNAYGPTESSVCATFFEVDPQGDYPFGIPIGRPIAGTEVWILRDDELAPIGAIGEVCLAGAGLARGYLGRSELTAASFVPHPQRPGQRLYRTGDLGRWRADGVLLYVGRKDDEVKVRGHRVAPAEVERAMLDHPWIGDACVIARQEREGTIGLAGYYTQSAGIELWPSVAEFYVYDDVLYHAMASHHARNACYLGAFRQALAGRIVVEIGPGPEVILARMCLEAGAAKVYCVELLRDTYEKARAHVEAHGLSDRIVLIHGDAMEVILPEPADWCVSEIVGSIGGSEGAARIINSARRFLRDPRCMLPERSITRIAGVSLPAEIELAFSDVAAHYVERIFADRGSRFDLRLCLKNIGRQHLISTEDVFEELDFTRPVPLEDRHGVELMFTRTSRFHGFLVWLVLAVDRDHVLDTLDSQESWLPIFLPVCTAGIEVGEGDVFVGEIIRSPCKNGLNPDYRICGRVRRAEGSAREPVGQIDQWSRHDAPGYRATPFYAELWGQGDRVPEIKALEPGAVREFLAERLPHYMIPTHLSRLPRMPLASNGKIDRAALPAPSRTPRAAEEAPRNPIEEFIGQIWCQVLGCDSVGMKENFFDVGGHSLRMVQVQQRITERFGAVVSLVEMFQHPTIEALAVRVAARTGGASADDSSLPRETAPEPRARRDRKNALAEQRATRRAHRSRATDV